MIYLFNTKNIIRTIFNICMGFVLINSFSMAAQQPIPECPRVPFKQGGEGLDENWLNSLLSNGSIKATKDGMKSKVREREITWHFVGVIACTIPNEKTCDQKDFYPTAGLRKWIAPANKAVSANPPKGNAYYDGLLDGNNAKTGRLCYYHYTPGNARLKDDDKKNQLILSRTPPNVGDMAQISDNVAWGLSFFGSNQYKADAPPIRGKGRAVSLNQPHSRGKTGNFIKLTKPGKCPYVVTKMRVSNKEILNEDVFNALKDGAENTNGKATIKGKDYYLWSTASCEEWTESKRMKRCMKFKMSTGGEAKKVLKANPMKKSTAIKKEGMVLQGEIMIPSDLYNRNGQGFPACVYIHSPLAQAGTKGKYAVIKKQKAEDYKIQSILVDFNPDEIKQTEQPKSTFQKAQSIAGGCLNAIKNAATNVACSVTNILFKQDSPNSSKGKEKDEDSIDKNNLSGTNSQSLSGRASSRGSKSQEVSRTNSGDLRGKSAFMSKNQELKCPKVFPSVLLKNFKKKDDEVVDKNVTIRLNNEVSTNVGGYVWGAYDLKLQHNGLVRLDGQSTRKILCKYRTEGYLRNGPTVEFELTQNNVPLSRANGTKSSSRSNKSQLSKSHSSRRDSQFKSGRSSKTDSSSGATEFFSGEDSSSFKSSRSSSQRGIGSNTSGE